MLDIAMADIVVISTLRRQYRRLDRDQFQGIPEVQTYPHYCNHMDGVGANHRHVNRRTSRLLLGA